MEEEDQFRFLHRTTISIVGGTSSGKTSLLLRILKNAQDLFCPAPKNLVVVYSKDQPLYEEIKQLSNIEFVNGVDYDFDSLHNSIVVLDDNMSDMMNSSRVKDVYVKGSHHNKNTHTKSLSQRKILSGHNVKSSQCYTNEIICIRIANK